MTATERLSPEEMVAVRKARGLRISKRSKIRERRPGEWFVPSESSGGAHVVLKDEEGETCSCPDFEINGGTTRCKHVWAVEYHRKTEMTEDGKTTTTTETLRVTYRQDWPNYNAAQCHEKEYAAKLLRGLCDSVREERQGRGRPRLPACDRVFAATMKVFTTLSTRRADGDMRDWAAKGFLSKAPSYNSVIEYLDDPKLTPILTAMIVDAAAPLRAVESQFAIDSSGFTTAVYRRWYDEKYGKERSEALWLKAHLMCGTKTNAVTSVMITDGNVSDSPQLPALLDATMKRFDVKELSADKGYSSFNNLEYAGKVGVEPFVAYKRDTLGTTGPEIWRKMFGYFQFKREEFLGHYHRRSNVESTFSMIKRKFGGNLRSKTRVAQENELLAKILCHNLSCLVHAMFELNVVPEFWPQAPTAALP